MLIVTYGLQSLAEAWATSPDSVSISSALDGQPALRTNPAGTGVGWAQYVGPAGFLNLPVAYFQWDFAWASNAATASQEICGVFDADGAAKMFVHLNTSGRLLAISRSGTMTLGMGTTVLVPGAMYRLELMVGAESLEVGNDGPWEIRVNGVTEMSGIGRVRASNGASIKLGKTANRAGGNSCDWYYRNLAVDDAGWPAVASSPARASYHYGRLRCS